MGNRELRNSRENVLRQKKKKKKELKKGHCSEIHHGSSVQGVLNSFRRGRRTTTRCGTNTPSIEAVQAPIPSCPSETLHFHSWQIHIQERAISLQPRPFSSPSDSGCRCISWYLLFSFSPYLTDVYCGFLRFSLLCCFQHMEFE